MKWPAIVATVVLGCACPTLARASARAHQSGSSAAGSSATSSTAKKTSAKKKKRHYARREPKQKAPTSDRISEIQSALARNGYYQGDPNGKWDSNTVTAMQKFQSDHGLDATGKLNALSLQKLGLGSDVAGVSAPRPITPASSAPASQAPPTSKPVQPSASETSSTASASAASAPKIPQQR